MELNLTKLLSSCFPSPFFHPPSVRHCSSFSNNQHHQRKIKQQSFSSLCHSSSSTKWSDRLITDFHSPLISSNTTNDNIDPSLLSFSSPSDRFLPLLIDFYQVLGAEPHFLSDGIRRAFDARVSKPPQHGFSSEALVARRQILQAACDTLCSPDAREEYDRGLLDDPEGTVTTHIPWDKVPGALCVLQEAGESKAVLQVGQSLLTEALPKSFKQDVVLAMALAYVDQSRDAMALSPPDFIRCCEVLEMALKLLQFSDSQEEGASNLAPDLQLQIDDTLEEITPRCVLELLALPLDKDHQIRRDEGLCVACNILSTFGRGGASAIGGGFTREDFMKEAFLRMTAFEQVNMFSSLPSSIPAEPFEVYGVALAFVAQAFVYKKPHLVKDAENHFLQLQQIKGTSLGSLSEFSSKAYLGRGMCSLLLGKLNECRSFLGLDSENSPNRDSSVIEFITQNCNGEKDEDFLPGLCKLLESWLSLEVLPRFRDTKDVSLRLGDYYDNPTVLRYLESLDGVGGSPLAAAAAIVRLGAEAAAALSNAKSSAFQALQKVFPLVNKVESLDSNLDIEIGNSIKVADGNDSGSLAEVAEKHQPEAVIEEDWTKIIKHDTVKIMSATVVVGLLTLAGLKFLPGKKNSRVTQKEIGSVSSLSDSDDHAVGNLVEDIPKMDARNAETLIRKWQYIKSQALGPGHNVAGLAEVLDGRMLKIWTDRAAEAAKSGWFWEYTLLGVTVDSVTLSFDGRRAIVETTIEEGAQLTSTSQPQQNDSSTTTYSVRYEFAFSNDGWKITEGAVLKS